MNKTFFFRARATYVQVGKEKKTSVMNNKKLTNKLLFSFFTQCNTHQSKTLTHNVCQERKKKHSENCRKEWKKKIKITFSCLFPCEKATLSIWQMILND